MPSNKTFNAIYYDGKSAKAHRVQIGLGQKNLHILLEDATKTIWSRDDVTIVQNPEPQQTLILANKKINDARVVVADDNAKEFLFAAFKGVRSFTDPKRFLQILAAAIFLGVGFITLWTRLTPYMADHIPFKWEKKLGESMLEEFKDGQPICQGKDGVVILNEIQARLQRDRVLKNGLHLVVLDSPGYNALSAPGNVIMVLNDLIQQSDSVDEVAGVIAHEMGHEIEHHPTKDAIRSVGINAFIGLTIGNASNMRVAGLANTLVALDYTRSQERQADVWAVQLMQSSGYDIKKLIAFFNRIPETGIESNKIAAMLSSHPATSERIEFLKYSAAQQKNVKIDPKAAVKLKMLKRICSKTEKQK